MTRQGASQRHRKSAAAQRQAAPAGPRPPSVEQTRPDPLASPPSEPAQDRLARPEGAREPARLVKDLIPAFAAGLPALIALLGLALDWFPQLRPPLPPPELRRVEIIEASVAERNATTPGGEEASIVYVEIESTGYDSDAIAVEALWINPQTLERIEPDPQSFGDLTTNTRTDRVVGALTVVAPRRMPPGVSHCMILRVLLTVAPEDEETETDDAADVRTPPGAGAREFVLDVADTAPFDPYDLTNASCQTVEQVATPVST